MQIKPIKQAMQEQLQNSPQIMKTFEKFRAQSNDQQNFDFQAA